MRAAGWIVALFGKYEYSILVWAYVSKRPYAPGREARGKCGFGQEDNKSPWVGASVRTVETEANQRQGML